MITKTINFNSTIELENEDNLELYSTLEVKDKEEPLITISLSGSEFNFDEVAKIIKGLQTFLKRVKDESSKC